MSAVKTKVCWQEEGIKEFPELQAEKLKNCIFNSLNEAKKYVMECLKDILPPTAPIRRPLFSPVSDETHVYVNKGADCLVAIISEIDVSKLKR
jgi:hypothetical protein